MTGDNEKKITKEVKSDESSDSSESDSSDSKSDLPSQHKPSQQQRSSPWDKREYITK